MCPAVDSWLVESLKKEFGERGIFHARQIGRTSGHRLPSPPPALKPFQWGELPTLTLEDLAKPAVPVWVKL
jgi:hypothetical protein